MKYIFVIIAFILIRCNETSSYKLSTTKKKSEEDTLKPKLIGLWGGLDEDEPVWEIKGDSIYYFEESSSYPYKIIHNDVIIDYAKSITVLKDVRVIKDTFFFYDDQGILTKAFRFRNKK